MAKKYSTKDAIGVQNIEIKLTNVIVTDSDVNKEGYLIIDTFYRPHQPTSRLIIKSGVAMTHNELLKRLQANDFNKIEIVMKNGDHCRIRPYYTGDGDYEFNLHTDYGFQFHALDLVDLASQVRHYERLKREYYKKRELGIDISSGAPEYI